MKTEQEIRDRIAHLISLEKEQGYPTNSLDRAREVLFWVLGEVDADKVKRIEKIKLRMTKLANELKIEMDNN